MSHVPIVGTADLGTSLGPYTEAKRMQFRLHGFDELPHEVGKYSVTPSIECFGYKWHLYVFPGGWKEEHEGKVGVFLRVDDNATPSAKFTMRLLESDGAVFNKGDCTHKYKAGYGGGWANCSTRTSVIEQCLVDGTLTVEVDVQVRSNAAELWAPKTRIVSDFARLLESGTHSDVTFVLGEERIAATTWRRSRLCSPSSTRTCSTRLRPRPTRGRCSSWPTASGAWL